MSDQPCPACGLPVSAAAINVGRCPCCEHSFLEPTVPASQPVAQAPIEPQPKPASHRNRVLIGVAACVLVVIGLIGTWQLLKEPVEPNKFAETVPTAPPVPAGRPSLETTPGGERLPPVREIAPAPRPVNGQRPDGIAIQPAPIPVAPELRAKPEAGKVAFINVLETPERKLNNPTGTAEVLELNGKDRLVLTGKVKVLKIGLVDGEAVLDASGLDVEEIIFTENVNGSAVVKLNAPGGKVRITRQINGSARLTIHAPDGEAVFAGEDDACLTGGSVVAVTAKRVDIQSLMNGGTRVEATLTSGGSLRTRVMDGGAAVRYKPTAGNEAELKIETGELRGGATVRPTK